MDKCPVYLTYKCPVCLLFDTSHLKLPKSGHHNCYYWTISTINIQAGISNSKDFQSTRKKLSRSKEMWKEQQQQNNGENESKPKYLAFMIVSAFYLHFMAFFIRHLCKSMDELVVLFTLERVQTRAGKLSKCYFRSFCQVNLIWNRTLFHLMLILKCE